MKIHIIVFLLLLIADNSLAQAKDTLYTIGNDGYVLLTQKELDQKFEEKKEQLKNLETKFEIFFDPIKEEIRETTLIRYGMMHLKEISLVTDADRKNSRLNKKLPEFEFSDLAGKTIHSAELKGKVVFLNFWFTRCAPCIAEIPYLNQIKKDYADKDILFISMAPEKQEKIEKFLQKHTFDFRHIPDADDLLKQFGTGFPKNILIDKNGMIQYIGTGLVSGLLEDGDEIIEQHQVNEDYIRIEIDKLLAQ